MKKKFIILSIIFFWIIAYTVFLPQYQSRDGLCIVGYHGVVRDVEKETLYKNDRYTLSVSQFEKQIKYFYKQGYTTYSMEEVEMFYENKLDLPEKAIVLTFDDGLKNFKEIVEPILEKYRYKGTCFVIGKHAEDPNEDYLKLEDLENTKYVEFYSHSYDLHRKSKKGINRKIIEDLTEEEIKEDFLINNVDSTYFAFPYGRCRKGMDTILEEMGVELAFTYNNFKHMQQSDDRFALPRYMIVDCMPMWYIKWITK